jgi:hypothetical protein
MSTTQVRKPKKHYKILLNGQPYGDTWAVSAKKTIANVWWNYCKTGDKYKYTALSVEDFDAVEI